MQSQTQTDCQPETGRPTPGERAARIAGLQRGLGALGVDAALLGYSRSTLYYGGTTQPSVLAVTPDRYRLLVSAGFDRAREESDLSGDRLGEGRGYPSARETLDGWGIRGGRLGLELDVLSAKAYLQLSRLFPRFELVDVSRLPLEQRKRKSPSELDSIRSACRMVHSGHLRALDVLREGMTELELSAEIEDAHRLAGHEGLYFIRQLDFFMGRGPLASGENLTRVAGRVRTISGVGLSTSIPMGASNRRIERGDLIVVDIPTHSRGYHCDQSRTYSVGRPRGRGAALCARLKDVADRLIEELRPDATCGELYERSFAIAEKAGLGGHFMRLGSEDERVSFIGHGLGLELNEPPLLARGSGERLSEGMVLTLELETGGAPDEVAKLEDTVLVTARGGEILTLTPRVLHQV